jgi:putative nucleotidyltransferase with HDIG domain
MFIAKACGQFNQRMLEIVGQGGFLHDIGLIQLPRELIEKTDPLPNLAEEYKNHPQLGLKMVENASSIPDEVRYIIYQHHEQPGEADIPMESEARSFTTRPKLSPSPTL